MKLTRRELRGSLAIVAVSAVAICIALLARPSDPAPHDAAAEADTPVVTVMAPADTTSAAGSTQRKGRKERKGGSARSKAAPLQPRDQGLDNVINEIPL